MRVSLLQSELKTSLAALKSNGLFKTERVLVSPQSSVISTDKFRDVLNFCSNNYLGLCSNESIAKKASEGLLRGLGNGVSSAVSGRSTEERLLERELSDFYAKEDCLLYSSCFDVNESIFESLLSESDTIVSDRMNHASIINGIRLSSAQRLLYAFNDPSSLLEKLQQVESSQRAKTIIVTDGVFSMDGEIAKLTEVIQHAKATNSLVMVDECHGTGVVGRTGQGACEETNTFLSSFSFS